MLSKILLIVVAGGFTLSFFVTAVPQPTKDLIKPDTDLIKYKEVMKESKEKIKDLHLHRVDKEVEKELDKMKVFKLENKILREERNSFKPDTVKVIVKDTVFLTRKDTVVKRTWLDKIINK